MALVVRQPLQELSQFIYCFGRGRVWVRIPEPFEVRITCIRLAFRCGDCGAGIAGWASAFDEAG